MADGFRIAFCIECHKYTPVLQELCRQLQHPEADIFIHVDAKSDIGDFAPLRPLARFIHPRSKVYWGEYGQIDCMLKLLRATCNGDYRYIAILSGDTAGRYTISSKRATRGSSRTCSPNCTSPS